jgi:type VI secretion system secreted protein VgrG
MSLLDSASKVVSNSASKVVNESASKLVNESTSKVLNGSVSNVLNSSVPNVLNGSISNALNSSVPNVLNSSVPNVLNGSVTNELNSSIPNVFNGSGLNLLNDSASKLNEPASTAKFTFEIIGSGLSTSVVSFGAHEEMSTPYLVNLFLASYKTEIEFKKVLGKDALLTIVTSGKPRYFHGIIAKFKRAGQQGDYLLYQAQVVPYLALLGMSTDCRIFQNMTVVDIVKDILEKKHGISSDRCKFLSLTNNHLKRDYCVQYRETDLDFISRLLSEEGIFYYFEHSQKKHVMVCGDNPMNYREISGETTVTVKSASGMNQEAESISDFDVSHTLTTSKVEYKDFNYENTPLELNGQKDSASKLYFEVYDYPGNFQSPEKGEQLANIHFEALNTFKEKGEGVSICPRLAPGSIFSMDQGEPIKYLAVSVAHGGYQPQVLGEQASSSGGHPYSNDFLTIPASVTYRPRLHPKPIVMGLQTATVVGRKGEEIHTDDYGRIMVHFHWDRLGNRDENSSCWIRVAQSWGGGARGGQFVPRIGDEVLVSFLEGDPDRPIITGSVYNSDNQPINNLKQSITQSGFKTKTHKGDGFHELRFDDANGSEEIFLHSQKDLNVQVQNRRGKTIGGDSGIVVGNNYDLEIGGASYIHVKGKSTKLAKEIVIGASDTITLVCGASSIVIAPGGIKINGPRIDLKDGSSAPMPTARPIAGSTGKSSGGGGGKSGGGSSAPKPEVKKAPKPETAKSEPAKPDDGWKAGPVVDIPVETPAMGLPSAEHLPTGGWGGPLSTDVVPPIGKLPTGVIDEIPREVPSLGKIKDTAINAGRNKLTQGLDSAKGNLLEKTGLGDVQNKMAKLSEKPASLLGDAKINPNDVIKKF